MQTQLAVPYAQTPQGQEAEAILRRCVHCGFCTATCPTYQVLGDERDSPRGRIYLIKQVLEGATPTRSTQLHLDRCLTCRNCETTCPSGVAYGRLVDLGRQVVEQHVPRPRSERWLRWALKEGLTSRGFSLAMRLGQWVRAALPAAVRAKVPVRRHPGVWPVRAHARQVLLLAGCVQPAMSPNINHATARVLDACGIQTVVAPEAGCCGALRFHLNDQGGGLEHMRHNIDAWWPHIERGRVEAIVMNASGCGVMVKEYGHLLRDDPLYADKAARVSALCKDLSELLPQLMPTLRQRMNAQAVQSAGALAYHPPCTLQHGQRIKSGVQASLQELGFDVQVAANEAHLCCGSAGTYSVLQATLSKTLRDRKLAHLHALAPRGILSANIGCITHLQSATTIPVEHWIEVVDRCLHP